MRLRGALSPGQRGGLERCCGRVGGILPHFTDQFPCTFSPMHRSCSAHLRLLKGTGRTSRNGARKTEGVFVCSTAHSRAVCIWYFILFSSGGAEKAKKNKLLLPRVNVTVILTSIPAPTKQIFGFRCLFHQVCVIITFGMCVFNHCPIC